MYYYGGHESLGAYSSMLLRTSVVQPHYTEEPFDITCALKGNRTEQACVDCDLRN